MITAKKSLLRWLVFSACAWLLYSPFYGLAVGAACISVIIGFFAMLLYSIFDILVEILKEIRNGKKG